MKRFSIQIAVLMAVLATGILVGKLWFGADSSNTAEPTTAAVKDWTCPMHPQIRQPDAGMCPICGMDLVPADVDQATDAGLIKLGDAAATMADIQTTRVQRIRMDGELTFNGKLAVSESALSEQVLHFPGRVEQLLVTVEGSVVSKGQPIADVYAPGLVTAQQEWLDALQRGQQTLADAAYQRLRQWNIREEQLAEIATNGKPSSIFTVLADQSGTVLSRNVNTGDYVPAGGSLLSLASLTELWAWLDVYEQDLSAIRPGQQVSMEITTYPGKFFTGQIDFIDPRIDANTRTAKVRVTVDNSTGLLKPDMFLTATTETVSTTGEALWIPHSAVLWTGPRSVVYVATDGGYRLREVGIGQSVRRGYEVTAGLEEGEEVVTNGAFVVDAAAELTDKTAMMNRATAAQQQVTITEAMMQQWAAVVKKYLVLKNHLIDGNGSAAQAAAAEMSSAVSSVDVSAETTAIKSFWPTQQVRLRALSNNMANTDQIDKQRKEFIDLSKAMISAAKTLGTTQALFVQYCPMANDDKGAYWLSESNQVLNPYFGDMMLRCGTVEETIGDK